MPNRSVEWLLAARAQANCLHRPVSEAGPGGVADVVRRTAGLQAQSWRGAAYAVRARSTATRWADVEQAREIDRSVIRGWFMRGTLQLVPTEDAGRLLGLLAPKLIKDTERRYAELGLTEDIRTKAADLLESHLQTHGPTGRAELGELLVRARLVPEPTGQAVYALIRHAGLLGRLCYGPGHDSTETWVATRDWLGRPLVFEPDGADELALRYLTAYGPATAQDFATWSGLAVPAARAAVKRVATIEFTVAGDALAAVEKLPGSHELRLLGEFDPYLLGYRDRRYALETAYQKRIHPGGGMLKPAVVQGGRVIGSWQHRRGELELFGTSPETGTEPATLTAMAAEFADVGRFQG